MLMLLYPASIKFLLWERLQPTRLEATLNKETEGEHEINFKIKDVFELLKDNDSARQLLDRWLNRRHKKWG